MLQSRGLSGPSRLEVQLTQFSSTRWFRGLLLICGGMCVVAGCAGARPGAEPQKIEAAEAEERRRDDAPDRGGERPAGTNHPVSPGVAAPQVANDQSSGSDFGAMPAVLPSAHAERLRELGLNPAELPQIEAMSPVQRFGVMKVITESLGVECDYCHQGANYRAPTPQKEVARFMWNKMTAPHSIEGGELFCDSCHQGKATNLERTSTKLVEAYMFQEYAGKLVRRQARAQLECSDCHGDPFQSELFEKSWK